MSRLFWSRTDLIGALVNVIPRSVLGSGLGLI